MLKRENLNEEVKRVINLILILLNKQKILISKFALIIYDLYEINIDNEKSLKESLFNVLKLIEKSLKELITFIITFDLLIAIKKEYEKNNII